MRVMKKEEKPNSFPRGRRMIKSCCWEKENRNGGKRRTVKRLFLPKKGVAAFSNFLQKNKKKKEKGKNEKTKGSRVKWPKKGRGDKNSNDQVTEQRNQKKKRGGSGTNAGEKGGSFWKRGTKEKECLKKGVSTWYIVRKKKGIRKGEGPPVMRLGERGGGGAISTGKGTDEKRRGGKHPPPFIQKREGGQHLA